MARKSSKGGSAVLALVLCELGFLAWCYYSGQNPVADALFKQAMESFSETELHEAADRLRLVNAPELANTVENRIQTLRSLGALNT